MKVPVRWLADFVDTGLPPNELAHRLTMAGLEAERIDEIGAGWDNVYVGHVDRVERHPNADRLVLAEIHAGEHQLTVVTGAPNIAAGQKVALALAGARLIDGHSDTVQYKTLKPGVIRGVRSEGMACSEKELGLSDEHEGIMVLEADAPVGVPLKEWLGDTVVEFEITPNLVHAFSVMGIAREAAAVADRSITMPPMADLESAPIADDSLVQIEAADLCSRYAGVVIDGISVQPSPAWLTRRLIAAGMRPINNVVDVTNYVMLELGQPLHAFDRSHLGEGRIVVRRAKDAELIETLDHQKRNLTSDMLVIADAERAVAVAGVMGGVDSEVDERTSTILLESANFDMKSVRHTARALKLRTEASSRFERGLDPSLVSLAAARATKLLLDLCPGSRVVAYRDAYPRPVQPSELTMPFARIERVLGVSYEPRVVLDVLSRLGFAPALEEDGAGATLRVTVPTWRPDVTIPEDLVEEVARIVGYDTLPETLPAGRTPHVQRDPMDQLRSSVRGALVATGCYEAITYVSTSEDLLRRFNRGEDEVGLLHRTAVDNLVRLRNSMPADRPLLRPSLIPSLLEVTAENLKHQTSVRLCEIARVYLPRGRDELPHEAHVAAILLCGQREPLSRFSAPGDLDFFDLKGIVDTLLERLGITDVTFAVTQHPALHPGRAAVAVVGGKTIALLGELRPDVAAAFGIEDRRVGVAELDLDAILREREGPLPEIKVPRFLPAQQDFAVVVAEETPAADVERALLAGAGALATDIALFDVYRGLQIGEDKKSLAYRVTFTAPDRALTDAELGKTRGRIEKVLAQRVGGALRT